MDRLKEMLAQDGNKKVSANQSDDKGLLSNAPRDVYGTSDGRIVVISKTLKKALERGSDVLGESIMNLDYEIIQHGSKGILGIGSKPFKLLIGKAVNPIVQMNQFEGASTGEEEFPGFTHPKDIEYEPVDKNGEVKVVVRKSGIFIIVSPPKGSGIPATQEQLNSELFMKNISNYDRSLIEQAISEKTGEQVKIGNWQPHEEYDSKVSIEVTPDEMKAFAVVTAPLKFGRVLEVEDIISHLELKGVKYGILEDSIRNMLDNGIYNTPTIVGKGKPADNGKDAVITYNFRLNKEDVHFEEEEDGTVDYRKLDLVQNVVVGQILATKEPSTMGSPGRTITNKRLEAKPGNNIPLLAGKNAQLSEDGLEVVSEINGQVVFLNQKISVEPVYEVHGDVSLETGNIVFLGTVIITGSIEDGFSVKAAGNVEIRGSVGKANVEAEGDIHIKQGVLGKDAAEIKAGGDIIAKFIEHAKISAGRDVLVYEAIMHSRVDAGRRVLCIGKRAMVVGGKIRAREEVNAKEIGSKVSTETIVEVGIDPKSRERLNFLEEEKREAFDEQKKLSKDIITLKNIKGTGSLPEEKEKMLEKYIATNSLINKKLEEVNEEINEIRSYLNVIESKGRICASKMVHPGARIVVKNATLDVKDNFKFVTFVQEAGNIKVNPYEEYEEIGKIARR
ncbi:MAG: FapA family protein [Spirochaetes bacterium]|nr:FapA family protein [Spirochaetota bacterium]